MHIGHLKHLHKRKTLKNITNAKAKFVDKLVYLMSFVTITFTFDQIYKVWVNHEVRGISLLAWSSYIVSALVWTAYGYVHKERVIFYTNAGWLMINIIIVLGVLTFR